MHTVFTSTLMTQATNTGRIRVYNGPLVHSLDHCHV